MKISKKIVLNIIGLILLTNLVAIFIISNSTPKIFWDYLYKEKNKEIVTIKNSIIKKNTRFRNFVLTILRENQTIRYDMDIYEDDPEVIDLINYIEAYF